ncbi:hypothetical protein BDV19DRAFT_358377 [Aspergillus venezuelensis]
MVSTYPPPPPPPPITMQTTPTNTTVKPPPIAPPETVPGSFLVNLLIYNGHPFKDHWAYFVQSRKTSNRGIKIHVTGSVRTGFIFEIKRKHDLQNTEDIPTQVIPLAWVDGALFDGIGDSLDGLGEEAVQYTPVCKFERTLYAVPAPEKSLVDVLNGPAQDVGAFRRRIVQRDCQTWIVESARKLVNDGIFVDEVADFLNSIQQ